MNPHNMRTSEHLRKAKALIDSPEKWQKGCRDSKRMCAYLAICNAANFMKSANELTVSLIQWNDSPTTTHADVMAAFDRAIAAAEAQQEEK